MAPELAAIRGAARAAGGFEALRARALALYQAADDGPFVDIATRAAVVGALIGRAAVQAEGEGDSGALRRGHRRVVLLAGAPFEGAVVDLDRFEEAVAFWRGLVGLSDEEMATLEAEMATRGEAVGGAVLLSAYADLWVAIDRAVEAGETFADFEARLGEVLTQAWGDGAARRMAVIWHNLTLSSYHAGRYAQLRDPDTLATRPYWLLDVILDSRTSPICTALEGLVMAADSPAWSGVWPLLHHFCRTGVRAISEREAQRRGIQDAPPEFEAEEGFGQTPDRWSWSPEPADYPTELFDAYHQKGALP